MLSVKENLKFWTAKSLSAKIKNKIINTNKINFLFGFIPYLSSYIPIKKIAKNEIEKKKKLVFSFWKYSDGIRVFKLKKL